MMKNQWVAFCFILSTTMSGSAFGLQGENIAFPRLDGGGVRLAGEINLGNRSASPDQYFDEDSTAGDNFAMLKTLTGSLSGFLGVVDATSTVLGRVTAPIASNSGGFAVFVPSSELAFGHSGKCIRFDTQIASPMSAALSSDGSTPSTYATSPGNSGGASAGNTFATMDIFLHLLAVGTKEHLEDYSSSVTVGDTSVEAVYMGNGVFCTTGTLSASTEKSNGNYVRQFELMTDGGCLNHFWTARQRVLIDSNGEEHIESNNDLVLTTGCVSDFVEGENGEPMPFSGNTPSLFRWVANTSSFFFARDYCDHDYPAFDEEGDLVDENGDPVEDPNGDPIGPGGTDGEGGGLPVGCHPLKVLVDGDKDKGVIGMADIASQIVPTYHDLEKVTVVVVAGTPQFLCDLDVLDAKTGAVVVHMDAAQAAYDPATGMAVFDVSSVGPLDPGYYEVQVGPMYRSEVYVAIPGDANLDGTVDYLQDAAIAINNMGKTIGMTWQDGDFNCDQAVSLLTDVVTLINNFGETVCP